MTMPTLEDLWPCLQGVIPAAMATCARDGTPNVTFVSQVYYVDATHVAISFQFFNKTHRNVREHPFACAMVVDPRIFQAYRLSLRYDHSEESGPLFEAMSLQLDAIASYEGMTGVFSLRAADVYEVLSIERVEGYTRLPDPPPHPRGAPVLVDDDLLSLRLIADRLGRTALLSDLLDIALQLLEERFGLRHLLVFHVDEQQGKLFTLASRGYPETWAGSEIGIGDGLIGMVARARRPLHLSAIDHSLRYARAVRERAQSCSGLSISREVPLPGLPGAGAQIAVPLVSQDRLIGVLAAESRDPMAFMPREETILTIVAALLAIGIEQLGREPEDLQPVPDPRPAPPVAAARARSRRFCFFHADECVFVDDEYLIRNVPGRILWRLLTQYRDAGRSEFTNRELRMDPWLGLPEIKDNLESRLILLRKRLEQKCPDVRLVPRGRGRFALDITVPFDLSERRPEGGDAGHDPSGHMVRMSPDR